ncbi:MAG: helix-turn-helix transcriptional regulator [Candidatus Komeilibacteria bacterium]|nr:helix-turn-helix transcriptional regulator [Candidatus Komeilibacteria bacterium]
MPDSIGQKIKQIRRIKGITQKEIGDLLGCSEAQISHIENGNRTINMDDLSKLSKFLGVSYDSFSIKSADFVNFRHDASSTNNVMSQDMLNDFKKFAKSKIHGDEE